MGGRVSASTRKDSTVRPSPNQLFPIHGAATSMSSPAPVLHRRLYARHLRMTRRTALRQISPSHPAVSVPPSGQNCPMTSATIRVVPRLIPALPSVSASP